jgi:hypothetical protein
MKDKFMRGMIAGVLAGVVCNAFSYFSFHVLRFAALRYVDFASVVIYGRKLQQPLALVMAQLFQLGFSGFLGVLYAYLLPLMSTQYYRSKGIFYGVAVWGISYGVAHLYKLPELTITPVNTAISNNISAFIFGWVLAETYRWLMGHDGLEENS